MEHTNTKDKRESDSKSFTRSYSSTKKSNVMKRVLALLLMTICLAFAGAQSTPTAKAGGDCELVCGEPFVDPNDGQCKVMCCPQDEQCMRACELRLCN